MNNDNQEASNSTQGIPPVAMQVTNQQVPLAQQGRPGRRILLKVLYWFQFCLQPLIAVTAIVAIVVGLGLGQRHGLFVSSSDETTNVAGSDENIEYVCPMLCVPATNEPGRCPVCGMELKARAASSDSKDKYGLTIKPAARRLSNIKTVVAARMPMARQIKSLGKIGYDETSEATITAYVDGRLEKLLVDYTGAEVKKGENLAVLYSPELYASQVELLAAKKAVEESTTTRQRIIDSNQRLYESSRRRLIEFGLPEQQVDEIERSGKADSRIKIVSPMGGTVIEKLADEGTYIKTGTPLLKIVDLSEVWLMLELFPEDTAQLRLAQEVSVSIRALPGREFVGRVAFVAPTVDSETQTVSVRVVIPNEAELIRIGDYAEAQIEIDQKTPGQEGMVVVPRQSVLISGSDSVAYVETSPSRFEFRKVDIGPIDGEQIAILAGIKPGEHVVANAAFMVDGEFNISGKPSIIDPTRAIASDETATETSAEQLAEIEAALSELPEHDRQLAETQEICPVTEFALGSMGKPIKVMVQDRELFICCEGCRKRLTDDPEKYFAVLDNKDIEPVDPEEEAEIAEALSALSDQDRKLAETQKFCPVADFRLGGMGTPIKVDVNGQPVFICCEGCRDSLVKEPEKYLAIVDKYKSSGEKVKSKSQTELPQMQLPEMELPEMELPQMEPPK